MTEKSAMLDLAYILHLYLVLFSGVIMLVSAAKRHRLLKSSFTMALDTALLALVKASTQSGFSFL